MKLTALVALLIWSLSAQAHKPSDSYLRIDMQGHELTGRWDVPLRDLDYVLGLDADGDGSLQWREVRQRENEIQAFMLSHLAVDADGQTCTLAPAPLEIADLSDGPAASLVLAGECAGPPQRLTLRYGLFFDVDPQHRGLLQLRFEDTALTGVFSPQRRSLDFDLGIGSAAAAFVQYFRVGMFHIAIGLDHLLFLAGLLLPAVVWRQGGRWQTAATARVALIGVIKVVSAFTLAHAFTLSLASLDLLRLPTRLTESLVAATIVFAAANNLWPMVRRRLWVVAFIFGLIHGAGYASVLGDLGLNAWTLVVALLGFNLGVEGMQVAVAALWVPLAYRLRNQVGYQWGVVGGGSLLVAALGTIWFVERAFNLRFAW